MKDQDEGKVKSYGAINQAVSRLQVQKFLDTLGGCDKVWHFQAYNDRKETKDALVETGVFDFGLYKRLCIANERGMGVFVAINTHDPLVRRSKKSTQTINAIFIDLDDQETAYDKLMAAVEMLPATMVVESSPRRYHVYWVLEKPGSLLVDDFMFWQKKIAATLGSDPKIVDSSRVMRVPGFFHLKRETFMSHIVDEFTTGIKYSLDKLVSTFYGGRNCWLTTIAGRFRSNGLSKDELYDIVNLYNDNLDKPLDDVEVTSISDSVERYDPNPVKAAHHNAVLNANKLGLDTDKYGRVLPHDRNLLRIVERLDFVKYNQLTYQNEVQHPVPWPRATLSSQWEDSDSNSLKHYLNQLYNCDWFINKIDSVVDHVAIQKAYDPLLDYLNQLQWDGEKRIESVFQRFLHVEDSDYVRAVATTLFVGAIRRAYEPGCKFDYMIVFVGEEGGGKSKFGATIAKRNEFFTDSIGDIRHKDGVIGIIGKWIVEFQELKSLQGASSEHTKAFLSTQSDNIRMPYDRRARIVPRRNIFIGSTNNDRFITDVGANRRMLPIYTPTGEESNKVMDYKMLELEVDQLWAEAVVLYRDGHDSRMPQHMVKETLQNRLQNTESGDYENEIIEYMLDDEGEKVNGMPQKRTCFHAKEFYMQTEGANRIAWGSYGSVVQNRVYNAAKKVFSLPEWSNYKHGRYTTNGVVWRGWKLVK